MLTRCDHGTLAPVWDSDFVSLASKELLFSKCYVSETVVVSVVILLPDREFGSWSLSNLSLEIMEAAAEDDWCIGPSDDELIADCMDPSSKYFTPKDPEEITR